jgi:glycosyltransferase involved in cell wall biosynthesis
MNQPEISIIVPTYQAADVIRRCVSALSDQSVARERYEILVVDDGSTDGTVAAARDAGADRVLTLSHGGPAVARNAGVEAAAGDLVLFTDADCVPASDWVEHMIAPFADAEVQGVKGVYRTRQRSLVARFVQLEYEDK